MRHLWTRLASSVSAGVQSLLVAKSSTCKVCGQFVNNTAKELSLCNSCIHGIPWITDICCLRCGRGVYCQDCIRVQDQHRSLVMNRSAVKYDMFMKEWLAQYKFTGDERFGPLLGKMLGYAVRQLSEELNRQNAQISAMTFVPLADKSLKTRQFNQAEQLAKFVGSHFSIPVYPLLRRIDRVDQVDQVDHQVQKQSQRSRAERIRSLKGVFHPVPLQTPPEVLLNKRGVIVIVDDVYTTGSTLHECAEVLERVYRRPICSVTWAR